MTKEKDDTAPGAEAPADTTTTTGEAAKPRRRIARSASTAERPAFAPAADAAAPADAPPKAADEAPAASRPIRDMRAPRPAPGAAPPSGGRPGGPYPRGPRPGGPRPGGPRPGGPRPGGPRRPPPAHAEEPEGFRPGVPRGRAEPLIPNRGPSGEPLPRRDDGPRPPRNDGPRPPRRDDAARPPRRDDASRPPRRDDRARPPRRDDAPPADAAKIAVKAPPPPPSKPAQAPPKKEPTLTIVLPRAREVVTPKHQKPALTAKEALAAKIRAKQGAPKAEPKASTSESPATLAPEWVSATWEQAADALRSAASAAVALVDAWIAASNAAAVAAAAADNTVDGGARKAARRGLGVLRARGVAIPDAPKQAKVVEAKAEAPVATFVPPDPTGACSITITRREPSGTFRIAEVIFRDTTGMLDAGGGWVSGSQLRDAKNRVQNNFGLSPVAVPLEWARHRVAAALVQSAAMKRVVPLGFERCRDLVEPAPSAEPAHPVADLDAAITSEQAWALVPGSASLHQEPELRAWMPDRSAVDDLLQKLGEKIGQANAQEDQSAVAALLTEAIQEATDRFFSPEVREVISGRLRDAALSVRVRRGDARATEVLATARAIREAGLITSPPREVPFLVGMFEKAVSALMQQSGSLRVPVPNRQSA